MGNVLYDAERPKKSRPQGQMPGKGVRSLKVYLLAHDVGTRIHAVSMALPKFETYEEGSQIRRSSKRISASIIEGYAMRRYKDEFLHYLFRAYGSAEETIEHLDYIWETGSFTDKSVYEELRKDCENLSGSLLRFIQGVQREHSVPDSLKESSSEYFITEDSPDYHLES